ncbi:MAG: hypothetical protein JEY96_07930 [Bacteroidales bacterium]|nr:hypothetical protein [Bacteroidales bacterium]
MKKVLAIVGISILLVSCNSKDINKPEIEKLKWLIGNWENISNEMEMYESWEKKNDTVFYGESFALVNSDTVFAETMLLEQNGNDLLLTPTTKNQNDGNSITFKLISSEGDKFIFENKEHDFPQRIVYSNPQPDSIFAYIEGTQDGEYRKSDFPFKRVSK